MYLTGQNPKLAVTSPATTPESVAALASDSPDAALATKLTAKPGATFNSSAAVSLGIAAAAGWLLWKKADFHPAFAFAPLAIVAAYMYAWTRVS